MNSITAKLNAGSIIATLQMLRSAKKEVFLIVEGDDDIALFSQALSLPRSSFIACAGKERLMEVFKMAPRKGLDSGTIFLRDADFDGLFHSARDEVHLLVSDHYDFEMSLLLGRLFARIISEFLKTKASQDFVDSAMRLLLNCAAYIGAVRKYAKDNGISLKLADMDLRFISRVDMKVDIAEMVRFIFARSQIVVTDLPAVIRAIDCVRNSLPPSDLSSGKDLLQILSMALSKHYKCCDARECSEVTLSRMLRIAAMHDDIRRMSLYPRLVSRVVTSSFEWRGASLT